MSEYKKIESVFIHGGIYGDERTGAVNVPIYQTSTYEQLELGKHKGWNTLAQETPQERRWKR